MWMKIDDGLHAHRKTRAVIKTHPAKRRDAAPMGIWVLAGSWAAQNGTDGWVPEDELDRWDEDWEALVDRLVHSGYWWPQNRDGERGYGFNDWHDYNDPADLASKSGTYGNHVRWHVNEKRVEPGCEHCPKEPDDRGDIAPESGGDRGAISGGDSRIPSPPIALPEPEPDPNPTRTPNRSCASADAEREFDAWYATYPRKRGKGQAAKAYRAARKKATAETLLAAIEQQAASLISRGPDYCPYPATWLNGERWNDQPDAQIPQPRTRVQEHLALVQQLAAEENGHPTIPQIGQRR
jgi:hypothetical protein